MAKITWSTNDLFSFGKNRDGNGIVLADGDAIMLSPGAGRGETKVERGQIPEDAVPLESNASRYGGVAFEVAKLLNQSRVTEGAAIGE